MMMLIVFFVLSFAACQYVTTIAGSGASASIDGQGVNASFRNPIGVAVDLNGNLFVTDSIGSSIRKINSTGFVSTFAGSGLHKYADGQGAYASFDGPYGIYVNSIGNVYVADTSNQRIRLVNATGYVTTVAGNGIRGSADGQSTSASFNYPYGIYVDSSSKIYITDKNNHLIRMVNSSGYVSTIAGNVSYYSISAFRNDQGLSARFSYPVGIALDATGNIYVVDSGNGLIRMINSTGYVSTYAGNWSGSIELTDGPSATFYGCSQLSIDSQGNLFISDSRYNVIRMINTTGYVSTIAGSSAASFRDGYGTFAGFNSPVGISVDSHGNVYVAETSNNRIRKIDMNYTGNISTITSTTTSTTISTLFIPSTSSPITISPSIASISRPISAYSTLSYLELTLATSIQSPSSSSTNDPQNSIFSSSIYSKTEFIDSFVFGFFFVLPICYLCYLVVIMKRRKPLIVAPGRRFIKHAREMDRKMAELHKQTMSRLQKKVQITNK